MPYKYRLLRFLNVSIFDTFLLLIERYIKGGGGNSNMKIKENKSFFLMQFGDTPQLRVLDFLIGFHFFDYPITEIARESNVSYNSLKVFFPYFIQSGIVCKTRKIGKSDYFKLNLDNQFVKNLIKLDWSLTKRNVLPELKEEVRA
jgi:hypothetical protein